MLSGFFSEVQEKQEKLSTENNEKTEKLEKNISDGGQRDESYLNEKYTNQDLGDRKLQYERIMAKNYEWRNLNPYFVLQLGIDATEEDIKQR